MVRPLRNESVGADNGPVTAVFFRAGGALGLLRCLTNSRVDN
jgi:hypothetical protein